MQCDIVFSQGSVSTLFRCGEHMFRLCVNIFCLLTFGEVVGKSMMSCFLTHSACGMSTTIPGLRLKVKVKSQKAVGVTSSKGILVHLSFF